MKKAISAILGIGFTLLAQTSFAHTPRLLTSYNAILNALTTGHEIKAIINLEKCTSPSSDKMKAALNLRGGMNFKYYIDTVVPDSGKKVIKSSTNTLFRSYVMPGFYQLYTELQTFEDGSVQLYGALVNPATFVSAAEVTYQCHLSTASQAKGLDVFEL